MVNARARAAMARVLTPVARGLLRMGVAPDAVTVVGTFGVCLGALLLYPRGQFLAGSLVITAFVFSDMLDGLMARMSGRSSRWGAFLDSTLDRIGDTAVFGGLVLWFAGEGEDPLLTGVALYCLVAGTLTSYTKARAQGLGLTCDVGIAERADRLIVVLVATGLAGMGVPYVHATGLWVLAVAGTVTVVQRIVEVRRQVTAQSRPPFAGRA